VVSGAVNGVQPFAGSTNSLSRASSLPLVSTVAPARAVALAGEFCAVWPLALIRYWLTTLSLWSWSIDAVALLCARSGQHQVGAVEADVDDHGRARGDRGRRGCHGGLGARGDDERAVDLHAPVRCEDRRLDERALGARVGHRAAVA
jgi:hypothetical protein